MLLHGHLICVKTEVPIETGHMLTVDQSPSEIIIIVVGGLEKANTRRQIITEPIARREYQPAAAYAILPSVIIKLIAMMPLFIYAHLQHSSWREIVLLAV